jgi:hypothetical protein
MAEEEKVQVDEISNKALNQLKKTFEPTAEEKFEAKRIKAALASGGGGAGIAGAAAGMFGKKGGGFFKGLGKWLAIPVVMMASGIMKMGKGAWNMLTKMIKIIFWPIRWLLGMTGSKAIKDVGGVVKKTGKLGGMLGIFSKIMLPFVWITTIWAGWEGWLAAKDRNSDGVVSTYEKFLGGLEEMLKWLTLGFVDFSTFEKVKEKWAAFSFEKWVDDMVIAFGKFPEDLAKWMDNKTKGLGGFVESFGKILKEFLFGKGATATTPATGGVMGWMAENLSVDKVSNAMIGGIKLAVAFGKMLVRIGMIALIGTTGKEGQPETWTSTSLFGIINQKVEPNLKPIAEGIGKTIMSLLSWIDSIVGKVMMWVGDQLIKEGQAEGAGPVAQGIAKGIVWGRKKVAEKKKREAEEKIRAQKNWAKKPGLKTFKDTTPEGFDLLPDAYNKKAKELGFTPLSQRTTRGNFFTGVEPRLSADDITKPSLLGTEGRMFNSLRNRIKGLLDRTIGPSLTFRGAGGDMGMQDPTKGSWFNRGTMAWSKGLAGDRTMGRGAGWSNLMERTQKTAMGLNKIFKSKFGKGLFLTSGHRSDDQQSDLMKHKVGSLSHYDEKWQKKLIEYGEKMTGKKGERKYLDSNKNTQERYDAIDHLFSDAVGFSSSHQHGRGLDFAWPRDSKGKKINIGTLRRIVGDLYPGVHLEPEKSHIHMQPSNSMQLRMQQAQGLNNAALNTSMGMGGTTIINNNTNVGGIDQSTKNDSTNVFGSSTENKHTSVNHDLSFGLGSL